jgi:UDP-N-acetylglucosamine:LPS N-acetylglucosamine transferase
MNSGNEDRKPRVLLTIQGGGFFWQSRSVARALAQEFELSYVSSSLASDFPNHGLPDATWQQMSSVTTLADRSFLRKAANVAHGLWQALRVIRRTRPDAIVCVATSLAIPLCLCGKLLGKKTVFIESITRVSTPSTTGLILNRLHLCDRHYVQWPDAQALYRGAVYRGSVL